jgi:hypothetical protein
VFLIAVLEGILQRLAPTAKTPTAFPPNPWATLDYSPGASYVHAEDRPNVTSFQRSNSDPTKALHTELLPEPFVGDVRSCRALILLNNPGFQQADVEAHGDSRLRDAIVANLRHQPSDYPLLYLNPEFTYWPGGLWWVRVLAPVVRKVAAASGVSLSEAARVTAQRVAAIERYPYHSEWSSGAAALKTLPSFAYSKALVESALKRGVPITLLWPSSVSHWLAQVPALAGKFVVGGGKTGTADMSRGNIGPVGFDRIIQAILG